MVRKRNYDIAVDVVPRSRLGPPPEEEKQPDKGITTHAYTPSTPIKVIKTDPGFSDVKATTQWHAPDKVRRFSLHLADRCIFALMDPLTVDECHRKIIEINSLLRVLDTTSRWESDVPFNAGVLKRNLEERVTQLREAVEGDGLDAKYSTEPLYRLEKRREELKRFLLHAEDRRDAWRKQRGCVINGDDVIEELRVSLRRVESMIAAHGPGMAEKSGLSEY